MTGRSSGVSTDPDSRVAALNTVIRDYCPSHFYSCSTVVMGSMYGDKWWSKETVALVTGANQGIGFAIVKLLAKQGVTVILTSRDVQKGQKAVDMLKEAGLDLEVAYHQLDVTDSDSIGRLSDWVRTEFGGLDILINNAGIGSAASDSDKAMMKSAQLVLHTNYYGAKNVTQAMLPLFKNGVSGNRIINVSSMAGQLSLFVDEKWRKLLSSAESLTEALIEDFVKDCLSKFQENLPRKVSGLGVLKPELNYPPGIAFYASTKAALNAYTAVRAQELSQDHEKQNKFFVNCMCPGVTGTSMTMNIGHSPEEGADTAVWLALLPASECATGQFFKNRQQSSTKYIEGSLEELNELFGSLLSILNAQQA